jgi:hypothetical protein
MTVPRSANGDAGGAARILVKPVAFGLGIGEALMLVLVEGSGLRVFWQAPGVAVSEGCMLVLSGCNGMIQQEPANS